MSLDSWLTSRQHSFLGFRALSQDNYVDLYQYLDDFIALYLTSAWIVPLVTIYNNAQNSTHTQKVITTLIRSSSIGNTLIGVQRNNPQATMMASLSLPSMWMYSLMTIISIKTVRTSEEYHLCPFLGKGGSRPEPEPPPTPPPTGHKHWHNDSDERLFSSDRGGQIIWSWTH